MKQDNICGYCKEELGYCKCDEEIKNPKKTRGKTKRYSINPKLYEMKKQNYVKIEGKLPKGKWTPKTYTEEEVIRKIDEWMTEKGIFDSAELINIPDVMDLQKKFMTAKGFSDAITKSGLRGTTF